MQNLRRGMLILGGTLLLVAAFILSLLCAVFGRSNWQGSSDLYLFLCVTLVVFIGFVLAQFFAFRGLLRLEVERLRREEVLSHQMKAAERAVEKLVDPIDRLSEEQKRLSEEQKRLSGEQRVISERITQIRQAVEDLKA